MQQKGHRSIKGAWAGLTCMALLFVGLAQAQPVPGGKPMRPAATGPSPEEQMQKQLPLPAKPEEVEARAKIPPEQHCMKNPKCRQKLDQVRQGKRPAVTLPAAAGPSPEEKLHKSLPPPAMGPQGRVPGPVEWFFSWINPFAPATAMAQLYLSPSTTTPMTAEGLTFTPSKRYSSSPYGYMASYGVYAGTNLNYFGLFNSYSTPAAYAENKPFIILGTRLDKEGPYFIDIAASPSIIKIRHQYSGPILETWDMSKGCGSNVCHYQTMDNYAAGYQYWYVWVDPKVWGTYFYSITIKPKS
jgi:hypothetical protein